MVFTAKILLLGSGELGKEFAISAKRYGCYVVACNSYAAAPAMQVSDEAEVFSMLDADALRTRHRRDIGRITSFPKWRRSGPRFCRNSRTEGYCGRAIGSRHLHDHEPRPHSRRRRSRIGFADLEISLCGKPRRGHRRRRTHGSSLRDQTRHVVVGQGPEHGARARRISEKLGTTRLRTCAATGARSSSKSSSRSITRSRLLTVRTRDGVKFCEPIGHRQERGDYQESWQPVAMSDKALGEARRMAEKVVDNLGGYGIFGVEFFVANDEVIFSELSPRPHDTGMVTLISQNLSQFDLHARAGSGLADPGHQAAWSRPLPRSSSPTAMPTAFTIGGLDEALAFGPRRDGRGRPHLRQADHTPLSAHGRRACPVRDDRGGSRTRGEAADRVTITYEMMALVRDYVALKKLPWNSSSRNGLAPSVGWSNLFSRTSGMRHGESGLVYGSNHESAGSHRERGSYPGAAYPAARIRSGHRPCADQPRLADRVAGDGCVAVAGRRSSAIG